MPARLGSPAKSSPVNVRGPARFRLAKKIEEKTIEVTEAGSKQLKEQQHRTKLCVVAGEGETGGGDGCGGRRRKYRHWLRTTILVAGDVTAATEKREELVFVLYLGCLLNIEKRNGNSN